QNKAKKHHRSTYRRAAHEARSELIPIEAADPQMKVQQLEHGELVRSQLSMLSPKLRDTLVLRYFEDMSLEDMARVLDIPRTTVSSRIRLG
ncbi:MAG: sigma-70 family RNA polymerase sigma factor, partial [Planctomycetota bacterium]|nr:sigma-70 family RNA polymerase sigma factor [Planctomycetota bacterium]